MALWFSCHGMEKLEIYQPQGVDKHRLRQWQALDQQRKQYESEVLGEIDWEMGDFCQCMVVSMGVCNLPFFSGYKWDNNINRPNVNVNVLLAYMDAMESSWQWMTRNMVTCVAVSWDRCTFHGRRRIRSSSYPDVRSLYSEWLFSWLSTVFFLKVAHIPSWGNNISLSQCTLEDDDPFPKVV